MTKVTQAHIDARTQDILGAATHLFATKGIDATTMQEIAAEAGISAGAIYRYFSSKEDLLRAVLGDCAHQSRAWFDEAGQSVDSPLEALLDIGREAWDELKERTPEHMILGLETTLAAVRNPAEIQGGQRDLAESIVDAMEKLVRQAQAAGELDPAIDARGLALLLQACHVGSHVLALDLGEDADMDPIFDVLTELIRRLRPAAAVGPTSQPREELR